MSLLLVQIAAVFCHAVSFIDSRANSKYTTTLSKEMYSEFDEIVKINPPKKLDDSIFTTLEFTGLLSNEPPKEDKETVLLTMKCTDIFARLSYLSYFLPELYISSRKDIKGLSKQLKIACWKQRNNFIVFNKDGKYKIPVFMDRFILKINGDFRNLVLSKIVNKTDNQLVLNYYSTVDDHNQEFLNQNDMPDPLNILIDSKPSKINVQSCKDFFKNTKICWYDIGEQVFFNTSEGVIPYTTFCNIPLQKEDAPLPATQTSSADISEEPINNGKPSSSNIAENLTKNSNSSLANTLPAKSSVSIPNDSSYKKVEVQSKSYSALPIEKNESKGDDSSKKITQSKKNINDMNSFIPKIIETENSTSKNEIQNDSSKNKNEDLDLRNPTKTNEPITKTSELHNIETSKKIGSDEAANNSKQISDNNDQQPSKDILKGQTIENDIYKNEILRDNSALIDALQKYKKFHEKNNREQAQISAETFKQNFKPTVEEAKAEKVKTPEKTKQLDKSSFLTDNSIIFAVIFVLIIVVVGTFSLKR